MTGSSTAQPILRLGTRCSPLALAQAQEARARLCAAHGWEETAVELVPVESDGDKITNRPLAEIGGKALWTKELDKWLEAERIDAAVHSMKDVETKRAETMVIGAILPRAAIRDCLLGASAIADIPKGARVGTCAPRRAAQMLSMRPDCEIVPIRGNVATRMEKLESGECDVTLLALAGLERLGIDNVVLGAGSDWATALDPAEWIPAPGQGAIGVECRAGDTNTRKLLAAIDHSPSRMRVMMERALLDGLGGTCQSPVAMRSELEGIRVRVHVSLFSSDGSERIDGETVPLAGDWEVARTYGQNLIANAPESIRSLFAKPEKGEQTIWTSRRRRNSR